VTTYSVLLIIFGQLPKSSF